MPQHMPLRHLTPPSTQKFLDALGTMQEAIELCFEVVGPHYPPNTPEVVFYELARQHLARQGIECHLREAYMWARMEMQSPVYIKVAGLCLDDTHGDTGLMGREGIRGWKNMFSERLKQENLSIPLPSSVMENEGSSVRSKVGASNLELGEQIMCAQWDALQLNQGGKLGVLPRHRARL